MKKYKKYISSLNSEIIFPNYKIINQYLIAEGLILGERVIIIFKHKIDLKHAR